MNLGHLSSWIHLIFTWDLPLCTGMKRTILCLMEIVFLLHFSVRPKVHHKEQGGVPDWEDSHIFVQDYTTSEADLIKAGHKN